MNRVSMRKRKGYPAAILHGLITGSKPPLARHIYATALSHHILNRRLAD